MWNVRQCKLLFTLIGHSGCIFCVDLNSEAEKAFTGSGDRVSSQSCFDFKITSLRNVFNVLPPDSSVDQQG